MTGNRCFTITPGDDPAPRERSNVDQPAVGPTPRFLVATDPDTGAVGYRVQCLHCGWWRYITRAEVGALSAHERELHPAEHRRRMLELDRRDQAVTLLATLPAPFMAPVP